MALSAEDVIRVANLSRLYLAPGEMDDLTVKLGKIVELVDQLSEVDTENVEPMVHAFDLQNVLAPDVCGHSLARTEVLKNAPASDSECFRVPAVLG
ncbi:MAG: Asp-tRNA(Asn)/Glu-tRNA(Gln) amidotransferase subunit GatC [Pirellula sp.]|jgi:aspartyl-tRNA(Asn)/glutamyl-tRNA(Gln) amidotransferase subunit C